MKYSLAAIISFLLLTINAFAQSKTKLNIGDFYNEHTIFQIENTNNKSFSIPQLKGKNIILDFFSSTCVVCFRAMPKIDSLQRLFRNDIEFILIGKDDEKIRSIFRRVKSKYHLDLKTVFDSTIFSNLGIRIVPYYVWINKDGKIVSLTGPEEITEDNIKKFIKGESLIFNRYEAKRYFNFDNLSSNLDSNKGISSLLIRTLISEWQSGDPFVIHPDIRDSVFLNNFQVEGVTINDLYNYAYLGRVNWRYKQDLYEEYFPFVFIKDSIQGLIIFNNSNKRYIYSIYNAIRGLTYDIIQDNLKRDLQNMTGYKSQLTEVNAPCWILKLQDRNKLIYSHIADTSFVHKDNFELVLKNQPPSKLLEILRQYNRGGLPIFEQLGIQENITLQIDADLSNLEDVSIQLQKFGIKIEKGKRLMKAIVLEN